MRTNRGYGSTLVVLAASAAVALWSLGQVWVTAVITDPGMPAQSVTSSGSTIYPVSVAGAWVALAGLLAVVATRGRWRFAAAVIELAAAAAMGVAAVAFPLSEAVEIAAVGGSGHVEASTSSWWILVALATVLTALCAIATCAWGPGWRSLSARQDASGRRRASRESAWDALDRGEDPTALSERAAER